MEYSKDVKKLLKAVKDKEEENMESEKKNTDLEKEVTRREKCIDQKIQLKIHLEEQENYGKKLEKDIN